MVELNRAWRRMHSHTLLAHLGLSHTPVQGMDPVEVEGVFVWAEPLVAGAPFKLRMRACCPHCARAVPAGRLFQHYKVHANV